MTIECPKCKKPMKAIGVKSVNAGGAVLGTQQEEKPKVEAVMICEDCMVVKKSPVEIVE